MSKLQSSEKCLTNPAASTSPSLPCKCSPSTDWFETSESAKSNKRVFNSPTYLANLCSFQVIVAEVNVEK